MLRRLLICGVVLGLSIVTSVVAYAQADYRDLLNQGIKLYDELEYEKALDALLQAKQLAPHDATSALVEINKYIAFCEVALGKKEEAISHFVDAIRLNPDLELDPILTPKKILDVFAEAKKRFDREPPQIVFTPPVEAKYGDPFVIECTITDQSGVAWAKLYYKTPQQQSYQQLTMKQEIGDKFIATLTSDLTRQSAISYYIEAVDKIGNPPARAGTSTQPYTLKITKIEITSPIPPPKQRSLALKISKWTTLGLGVITGGISIGYWSAFDAEVSEIDRSDKDEVNYVNNYYYYPALGTSIGAGVLLVTSGILFTLDHSRSKSKAESPWLMIGYDPVSNCMGAKLGFRFR